MNRRTRTASALAALGLAGSMCMTLSMSPSQAEPDVDTVRGRVDKLMHEAEQASERYNDTRIELTALNRELGSLERDEKRQSKQLAGVRSDVRDSIIQRYQGSGLGAAGGLLSSDADTYLDQMSTNVTIEGIQDSLLDDYGNELDAYDIRHDQTQTRRDQIATLEKSLATEKETADRKLGQAQELLGRLEAKEREEILSRGGLRAPALADVPVSGRAKLAVAYALAQVGDAYVFGAAGPSAFDCSGLTMMAWAQAGVGLPHSSRAQSGLGASIAKSALQPGDLVFYYSPISHVAMYIGNGMIVHAANPGAGVRIDSVDLMPYAGAVRPG